ncbi:DnaJ domain-containing protein [Natrialbaceae archaeon GCM10025810]|uniref:DnaJ domain-containing protein n=1 Tax=Halovalidus salilacus TaxID=3075124 RepID=UPI003623E891
MTEDFYDLLDVPRDASSEEIKRAFREKVRLYHPDLNDDDRAQAQFTAVKKAYDILGDPVERKAYDRLGHRDYVAKRTSGIPSPETWRSSDGTDDADADETKSNDDSSDDSASASAASASSSGSTSAGSTTSSSGSATSRTSNASSTGGSNTGRTRTGSNAASASAGATDGGTTASATSATARGRSRRSESGAGSGTAVLRWWRRRKVSWPLLLSSVVLYLVGLGHFALVHRTEFAALLADLRAVGADPNGLWTLLSGGRHGIETPAVFVSSVEFVAAPLPTLQWYGALAGLVGLSLLLVLAARVGWRPDTWGPITTDELIVVSLAVGLATTLLGGPLLSGAVLMPLLFGVIVHRTRSRSVRSAWSPSYLWAIAVWFPAAGLAIGLAIDHSLPVDLVAFVLAPLLGGVGLPLRVRIRKRFGR